MGGRPGAPVRLGILDPVLTPKGGLTIRPRLQGRQGFESVSPEPLPVGVKLILAPHQYYGVHQLQDHDDWQPLPGVDPREKLTRLRTGPHRQLEVSRDRDTGLHSVRICDPRPAGEDLVAIHYLLEVPGDSPLSCRLPVAANGCHPDNLSDATFDLLMTPAGVDEPWTSDAAAAMQVILDASSRRERLDAIDRYCQNFADGQPPAQDLAQDPAQNKEALATALFERRGTKDVQASLFVLLCRLFFITARLVQGQDRLFAEASLDGGQRWRPHLADEDEAGTQQGRAVGFQSHAPGVSLGEARLVPFVRGLAPADRTLLASLLGVRSVCLDQATVTASVESTTDAATLQDLAVLDRLLEANNPDAFTLACRFLQAMERPGEAVWSRIADRYSNRSRLAEAVSRLCTRPGVDQKPIRQQLETLEAWAGQQREQSRWRDMLCQLFDRLACAWESGEQVLPVSVQARRKAVEAKKVLSWLLLKETLHFSTIKHSYGDYLVRAGLDTLGCGEDWGTGIQLQLRDWYRDWFAMPSTVFWWDAEPVSPTAGSVSLDDWTPATWGGQLPTLEALLLEPVVSRVRSSQPGRLRVLQQRLGQILPLSAGSTSFIREKNVLILGGLIWPSALRHRLPARLEQQSQSLDPQHREQLLQQLGWAFCHCLYDTVRHYGDELTVQIPYGSRHDKSCAVSGLRAMNDPAQLTRFLMVPPEGMRLLPVSARLVDPAREATGDPDALVLDSRALLTLADEFLASLDPELFWQESFPQPDAGSL